MAVAAAADKKANNIVVLDVSEQLIITDCFVIASAPNERQVRAVVDEVEEKLREHGAVKPVPREGAREGGWVLLDFVDVVVHVQHNEERGFYGLDRLWKDCAGGGPRGAGRRAGDGGSVSLRRMVLLRHGQTDYNLAGRMQGHLDSHLTDAGRAQAAAVAPVLAELAPDRIVSSDLRRAVDTADVVGTACGLPVKFDPRLRETHLGAGRAARSPRSTATTRARSRTGGRIPPTHRRAVSPASRWWPGPGRSSRSWRPSSPTPRRGRRPSCSSAGG